MGHEQFEEVVALYAVGALETTERRAFEAHLLTGCATCRRALTEYQAVASLLPHALAPAVVPSALKSHLLKAIGRDFSQEAARHAAAALNLARQAERGPHWISRLWPNWPALLGRPALGAASVLLLLVMALYALSLRSQVSMETAERQRLEAALQEATSQHSALLGQVADQEQTLARLREEITHAQGDLSELRETLAQGEAETGRLRMLLGQREKEASGLRKALAQRDEMLAILQSPRVKVVSLSGAAHAKSAAAFLLFDPETQKAFFYAFNLPPLPAGKTYQLWAIADKPISAGIFDTDPGQKSRLLLRALPDIASISKFAVSLEPAGGRPQPTGEIYLVGQL